MMVIFGSGDGVRVSTTATTTTTATATATTTTTTTTTTTAIDHDTMYPTDVLCGRGTVHLCSLLLETNDFEPL